MEFREQISSVVILGHKLSNTKFVYSLGSPAILYQACKQHWTGEWIYIAQKPLDNPLVLANFCEYRNKWYITKN